MGAVPKTKGAPAGDDERPRPGVQVLDEMRQRRLPPLLPMIVILLSSFEFNTEFVGHPHVGR